MFTAFQVLMSLIMFAGVAFIVGLLWQHKVDKPLKDYDFWQDKANSGSGAIMKEQPDTSNHVMD